MRVEWFDDERQKDSNELTWLLGDNVQLSRWSQLPNVCAHIQNSCRPTKQSRPTPTDLICRIQQLLKLLISSVKSHDESDNKVTEKVVLC